MTAAEKALITLLLFVIAGAGYYFGISRPSAAFGGSTRFCTSISQSTVSVGDDVATDILSASGARVFATIQPPLNATNTVSLSFGGAAESGIGYQLPATSTSIAFGTNTDFPFTGTVSAITNTGSTTINIIECK